jgi:Putative transposase
VTTTGKTVQYVTSLRADGATHLLLDPPELLQELSVLILAPRTHLLRYHGLLAPHTAWQTLGRTRCRGRDGRILFGSSLAGI